MSGIGRLPEQPAYALASCKDPLRASTRTCVKMVVFSCIATCSSLWSMSHCQTIDEVAHRSAPHSMPLVTFRASARARTSKDNVESIKRNSNRYVLAFCRRLSHVNSVRIQPMLTKHGRLGQPVRYVHLTAFPVDPLKMLQIPA